MIKRARFPMLLAIAGVTLLADRLTKSWFVHHYQLGETHAVFSWLWFTLVRNTGTAFGLMQENNRALLIFCYLVLGVFIYGARGLWERGGAWSLWGVALVIGGAIGNIIDRHLYGSVVDFIDLHFWPVFNVADSAITVGAVLIGIGLSVVKQPHLKPAGSRL